MIDPLLREKEDLASMVTIIASLVPAPTLLIFVNNPDLFARLDLWRLLLIAIAIGFGVLFATMFFVATASHASAKRRKRVRQRDQMVEQPEGDLTDWPLLYQTASVSNTILYCLTVIAYWSPFHLGATLVLSVALEMALSLVITALFASWPLNWTNPPRGPRRPPIEPSS